MGKFLHTFYALTLLFLAVGTSTAPNDAMFWLASGDYLYQVLRVIMILTLSLQLFTNPPRHTWFRIFTATVAIGIGGWALLESYNFAMPALDTFAFLAASIGLAVTALERRPSFNLPAINSSHRKNVYSSF